MPENLSRSLFIEPAKVLGTSNGALLASHRIPVQALRSDDFESFYSERQQALLELIEGVMGKKVAPTHAPSAESAAA